MQEKKKSPWTKTKLYDDFDLSKGTKCPYCGYVVDQSMLVSSKKEEPGPPDEGAISICIECMRISMFDKNLDLVMLDCDKEAEHKKDKDIQRILSTVRAVKRQRALREASAKQE